MKLKKVPYDRQCNHRITMFLRPVRIPETRSQLLPVYTELRSPSFHITTFRLEGKGNTGLDHKVQMKFYRNRFVFPGKSTNFPNLK